MTNVIDPFSEWRTIPKPPLAMTLNEERREQKRVATLYVQDQRPDMEVVSYDNEELFLHAGRMR